MTKARDCSRSSADRRGRRSRAANSRPRPSRQLPDDPETAQPGVADSDTLNNNFEFGDDLDGQTGPRAAHIRKVYPRDEPNNPQGNDSEAETRRLPRRGIPYGRSFGATHEGGANDPRGLLFQCYQRSIEDQFEFVQQSWVNSLTFPPFPNTKPGQDPLIAQSTQGKFELTPGNPIDVQHFVTTRGGEYFFSPSIDALQQMGAGTL